MIAADKMYSSTPMPSAHFLAYSSGTSCVLIDILLKPDLFKYISNSSTEEAPVTHPQ